MSPPVLVGRDIELESLAEALDSGPGDPYRATLVTGLRGSGKTVFLNAVEDRAAERGWAVISETARPGLVDELVNSRLPALLTEHDTAAPRTCNTAAGFGVGLPRQVADRYPVVPSLRTHLEQLASLVHQQNGAGVLITLDEIHKAAIDDLRQIAQVVQHLFREEREVMLVAAGLPTGVSDLLADEMTTFLRRAERVTLGPVVAKDVRRALREPIEASGRSITDDALEHAADGTRGYPFLVQSVGHRCWGTHPDQQQISIEDARTAVAGAMRRIGQLVHEPSLRGLPDLERSFLAAMAQDDMSSRTSDIATRLNASTVNATQYRLIAAGLIAPARHGYVDFTVPYLRTYLREHATSQAL